MVVTVVVPPNTTAEIALPGQPDAASIEVTSGTHHWRYDYVDFARLRGSLTVDSSVGELIDDPAAGPLVIAAINRFGTELADQVLDQETLSLREAISFMPRRQEIITEIASVLASLE